MIIRYISCDGCPVKEKVTIVEFCQDVTPPYGHYLRCTRENGDIFEIYDPADVDCITAE